MFNLPYNIRNIQRKEKPELAGKIPPIKENSGQPRESDARFEGNRPLS